MQWKIQQHNGFCTLIITNISVMLEEHNIDEEGNQSTKTQIHWC